MSTILNSPTQKLQVVLAGATSTNQMQWTVSYQSTSVSCGGTPSQVTTNSNQSVSGVTNNTAPVTMLTGPSSSATITNYYTILNITVFNADTASGQPTIQLLDTSIPETAQLSTALLAANGSLQCGPNGCTAYGPDGGSVIDGNSGYSGTSGFSGYSGTGIGTSGFSGFSGFSGIVGGQPLGQVVYGNGGSVTSDANLVWDSTDGVLSLQDNYGNDNTIIVTTAGNFSLLETNIYTNTVIIGDAGLGTVNSTFGNSVIAIGLAAGASISAFGSISSSNHICIGVDAGQVNIAAPTTYNNSIFLGYRAGQQAYAANDSIFIGAIAGYDAQFASNSVFIGGQDTSGNANCFGASSASNSCFIGAGAGYQASGAGGAVFMGYDAGLQATNASASVFIGNTAGYQATNAAGSVFIGNAAGLRATNASGSVFIGDSAGVLASSADFSVFIGWSAGDGATNAIDSTFVGYLTGENATNAIDSTFVGYAAGYQAANAANSLFLGFKAGYQDTINNISSSNWSMLIGNAMSAGGINTGGYHNSIFLGGNSTTSNYANTASNQLMITPEITTIVTKANLLGETSNVGTIDVGAAAGTGATVSVVGTQFGGRITLNAGTSTSTGTLCTLTYTNAFPTSSAVTFSPANNNAADLAYAITSDSSLAASFSLIANNVGLVGSNTYIWTYHVTGW